MIYVHIYIYIFFSLNRRPHILYVWFCDSAVWGSSLCIVARDDDMGARLPKPQVYP